MKIFAPIKSLFKFGKNPKDYKLVTRQDYTPIDKFANSYNITIPQNADTFSYVKIAKTDNEDKQTNDKKSMDSFFILFSCYI